MPKAQHIHGLSSASQSNFFRLYHKSENLTGHRMHVEGPQIYQMNRQNMCDMLSAKIDCLARKINFLQQKKTPKNCLLKCALDRFTKTFFWNFQNIRADLCYILIFKQMLEKVFCSNIAPSLSSTDHLFYKAEYMMGQSCLN